MGSGLPHVPSVRILELGDLKVSLGTSRRNLASVSLQATSHIQAQLPVKPPTQPQTAGISPLLLPTSHHLSTYLSTYPNSNTPEVESDRENHLATRTSRRNPSGIVE
jgi:hypothetical protein